MEQELGGVCGPTPPIKGPRLERNKRVNYSACETSNPKTGVTDFMFLCSEPQYCLISFSVWKSLPWGRDFGCK